MMAPCKRQLKATRHLICMAVAATGGFRQVWVRESWAEVQADSFSFVCRGCARMKELEVELRAEASLWQCVGREQGSMCQ